MKKILIANQKGGCGKTMTAVTVAAALANKVAAKGEKVALADADPQKSSLRWLKQRPKGAVEIVGLNWKNVKSIGDVPKDINWLVIDAPGALRGEHAEKLIAESKAIITPVLPSFFDADSTKRFLKEIDDIKRVKKGKVKVHLLANRIRSQNLNSRKLKDFFDKIGQQPLAWITERSAYAQLAEQGLSVFDKTQKLYEPMQAQWQPVIDELIG